MLAAQYLMNVEEIYGEIHRMLPLQVHSWPGRRSPGALETDEESKMDASIMKSLLVGDNC
jgi:hypothetical protein